MGAALCLCPGGKDEPELFLDKPHRLSHHAFRSKRTTPNTGNDASGCFDLFMQTQSGAETREMLSDEEREALAMRGCLNNNTMNSSARLVTTGFLNNDGLVLGDDGTESDEVEYYNRQLYGIAVTRPRRRMNAATAAAFRSKLKEPSMSPKSKLVMLNRSLAEAQDELERQDKDHTHAQTQGTASAQARGVDVVDKSKLQNDSGSGQTRSIEIEPISDGSPNAVDEELEAIAATDDDDEYFKYVRIIVPPGPCGVVFQTPTDPSMPPTVERFERMYDGRKGTIENCALVQRGSVLCSINDLDVTHIPLPDLLRALTLSSHVEREFVFRK